MSFLEINGWTVPVIIGGASGTRAAHGELDRAWTNRPNRYRRGLSDGLAFRTPKMLPPCADTLEALLDGRGHHIPLNGDLYSTSGLVPQGGLGSFTFPDWYANRPIYGTSYLSISSGSIIWNPGLHDGKWTVMYWRSADLGWEAAEHVVVRGDGAKWLNGARADATTTTEMTVSNGAVSFGVEDYDDIVILPYSACNDFVSAFTERTVNGRMFFYAPLDEPAGSGTVLDIVGNIAGTIAGAPTLGVDSQVATGIEFNGTANQRATFSGAGGEFSSFDNSTMTLEAWIRVDTNTNTFCRILNNYDSLGTIGWIWNLDQGASDYAIELNVLRTGDNQTGETTTRISYGAWAHVVTVWEKDVGITTYINGVDAASSFIVGTGVFTADGTRDLIIGDDLTATNHCMDGVIDDVAIYRELLTAEQVQSRYQAGLAGDRKPMGRPFSDLPYLDVSGDVVGGREAEMLGSVSSEKYIQYGDATGWSQNARETNGSLAGRKTSTLHIAAPDVGYLLSTEHLSAATSLEAISGDYVATLQNGVTADARPGPFGFGQSFFFDDTSSERVLLPTSVRDSLTGHNAVTVMAWIRQRNTNDQGVILSLNSNSTPQSILQFDVENGSGDLRIGGRSHAFEAGFRDFASAAAMDDSEWHHAVGFIDLFNQQIGLYLDGDLLGVQTQAGSGALATHLFEQAAFSDEQNGNSYIGAHTNGGLSWDGDIAFVGIWYRRLSSAEVRNHYQAGLKGQFR